MAHHEIWQAMIAGQLAFDAFVSSWGHLIKQCDCYAMQGCQPLSVLGMYAKQSFVAALEKQTLAHDWLI